MVLNKNIKFHFFVLSGLALSPLYGVLSKEPSFFWVHNLEPLGFLLLICFLSIVFPLIIAIASTFFVNGFPKFREVLQNVILSFLMVLVSLPYIKRILDDSLLGPILIAVFIGIVFSYCYKKYAGPGLFLSYISPSILIFPVLFVFVPQIFVLIFPKNVEVNYPKVSIPSNTPVIFILFDEFPLSSLLNKELLIDEVAFPNFKKLADNSHWFRNTSANYAWTGHAVMSALTGVAQKNSLLGTYRNFPNNLFTLMGHEYQVKGYESALRLCPPHICENQQVGKDWDETKIFWMDIVAIYLNLILPQANKFGVPDISQSYKDFWSENKGEVGGSKKTKVFVKKEFNIPMFESEFGTEVMAGREELMVEFLEGIKSEPKKAFNFLHILLPHMPYRFLSSGKQYDLSGEYDLIGLDQKASKGGTWENSEWLTRIQYQKFLNQVAYTDRLLGNIIGRLEELGIFDSSLFILSADHGVHIKEKGLRRKVNYENLGDIAPIPLFIKLPHQKKGEINDIPATSGDIVPTLADFLKIKVPWEMVGHSLFKESIGERKRYIQDFEINSYKVPKDLKPHLFAAVERKQQLFGEFQGWDSFRLQGITSGELLDQPVSKFQIQPFEEVQVHMKTESQIQTRPGYLPAIVQGQITGLDSKEDWRALIAVNGIFQAESPVMERENKKNILGFLPEQAFKDGDNKIEVYLLKKPFAKPFKVFKPRLSGD